jgi:hypothetical protein
VRDALIRLVGALVLGWIVAWVYRTTRPSGKTSASFQATLVLLAVLIAIVTQVVGTNTARAFSLVGALSIVRFRTVVQDTRDTAFVIFAVVMGMAVGAGDVWMSVLGLLVVSAAAFAMRSMTAAAAPSFAYTLGLRVGLGHDLEALVRGPFAAHLSRRRLVSMETARQGTAIQTSYQVDFRADGSAEALLKALNRTEGIENVQLQDAGLDDD